MSTTGIEASTRYATTAARPAAQVVMRIALWAAVFVGAAGGITGFFRSDGGGTAAETPVEASTATDGAIPGTVVAVAERAVAEWLTATAEDEDRDSLARLYVEPPAVMSTDVDGLSVLAVTTIAGESVADGLWTITVAVDLEEVLPPEDPDDSNEDPVAVEPEVARSTWYVEVSIVGDVDGGRVAAVATPTVISEPPTLTKDWKASGPDPRPAGDDDPVVDTVQDFLDALLAGGGDPARYVAPDVVIAAADPAPFDKVDVLTFGAEEIEPGRLWVQIGATGTSLSGREYSLAYDLVLAARDGRWEIVDVSSVMAE